MTVYYLIKIIIRLDGLQPKKMEVLMSDEKPAYILVDVKIKNDENYDKYKKLAKPLVEKFGGEYLTCLLYTSPSPRD